MQLIQYMGRVGACMHPWSQISRYHDDASVGAIQNQSS